MGRRDKPPVFEEEPCSFFFIFGSDIGLVSFPLFSFAPFLRWTEEGAPMGPFVIFLVVSPPLFVRKKRQKVIIKNWISRQEVIYGHRVR
jgi:hypothetical protein